MVQTTGDFSGDIVAQSIGGAAADGVFSVGDGAGAKTIGLIAIGAQNGAAGGGGTASVANGSQLTTTGTQAIGIAAQSIGGGGGIGGVGISGGLTSTAAAGFALGAVGTAATGGGGQRRRRDPSRTAASS